MPGSRCLHEKMRYRRYFQLPFRYNGTVLPALLPIMLAAAGVGVCAYIFELQIDPTVHSLLGFVLGFLLVIMGNFRSLDHCKLYTCLPAARRLACALL